MTALLASSPVWSMGAGAVQPEARTGRAGEADDPPEAMVDGIADVGAVATEFLLLGIDPYPRKPDAVFDRPSEGNVGDGPFAALAKLRNQ